MHTPHIATMRTGKFQRHRAHLMFAQDCGQSNCNCDTAVNITGYIFDNQTTEVSYNHNKIGGDKQWSTKGFHRTKLPVTALNECFVCKKRSTPKKVQYRTLCKNWNEIHVNDGCEMLCMGCWNKVRLLVKRENEVLDLIKLTRKLDRRRRECQRLTKRVN